MDTDAPQYELTEWTPETQSLKESEITKQFRDELLELFANHGVCIAHEDCQGSFQIVPFDRNHIHWILEAQVLLTRSVF